MDASLKEITSGDIEDMEMVVPVVDSVNVGQYGVVFMIASAVVVSG